MIPLEAQAELRRTLAERLRGRVKIDLFTQQKTSLLIPGREPCLVCPETDELVGDIARLSPLITLTTHQLGSDRALEARLGVRRVPSIVVRGALNRPLVFSGLPLPPLFSGLFDLILLASLDRVALPVSVSSRLRRLREAVNLVVYVANQAEFCREMMSLVYAFGAASKQVRVEVVELDSFPALAASAAPEFVPFTSINGRRQFFGLVSPETLMDLLVQTLIHPTVLAGQPETLGMAPYEKPQPEQPRTANEPTRLPSGLYLP